jgi:proteasome lid subunit RPN8/RPN11
MRDVTVPTPTAVVFDRELLRSFVADAVAMQPRKVFGFFVSSLPDGRPEEYVIMRTNQRDTWRDDFATYGRYFVDHRDAGFVCSPVETWNVERYLRDHGLRKVGVFHSHHRHPALLTSVDADFHPSPDLWHLLLVLRNPAYPQVRVFGIEDGKRIRELDVVETGDTAESGEAEEIWR